LNLLSKSPRIGDFRGSNPTLWDPHYCPRAVLF